MTATKKQECHKGDGTCNLCKVWSHSKRQGTAGIKDSFSARQQGTSRSRRALKPRRFRAATTSWLLHVRGLKLHLVYHNIPHTGQEWIQLGRQSLQDCFQALCRRDLLSVESRQACHWHDNWHSPLPGLRPAIAAWPGTVVVGAPASIHAGHNKLSWKSAR